MRFETFRRSRRHSTARAWQSARRGRRLAIGNQVVRPACSESLGGIMDFVKRPDWADFSARPPPVSRAAFHGFFDFVGARSAALQGVRWFSVILGLLTGISKSLPVAANTS